jgi:aryl-alcohol dehydrogenase-like predicted oxidoreductase
MGASCIAKVALCFLLINLSYYFHTILVSMVYEVVQDRGEMMESFTKSVLGRTGLDVCRLGLAGSYGAPSRVFEEAFERGCNYFYVPWRKPKAMIEAVRNLCGQGRRDDMVVAIQTYARYGVILESTVRRRLRSLGVERADVLILAWHNHVPSRSLLNKARQLKEKGLVRYLAMSGHNRSVFPQLGDVGVFDVFHVRYNAAHRGAETEVFPHLKGDNRPGIVTYTATRWGDMLNSSKMPQGYTHPRAADCYRFVMSNPSVDICLSGPKDLDQAREALAALELGPMTAEEMERMRAIGDHVHQVGRRFF